MRCKSCDNVLEEHELKRRGLFSTEYIDLCDHCFESIEDEVPTYEEGETVEKL